MDKKSIVEFIQQQLDSIIRQRYQLEAEYRAAQDAFQADKKPSVDVINTYNDSRKARIAIDMRIARYREVIKEVEDGKFSV